MKQRRRTRNRDRDRATAAAFGEDWYESHGQGD